MNHALQRYKGRKDTNCGQKFWNKKLDSETKLSTRMINQTNEGFVETKQRGII